MKSRRTSLPEARVSQINDVDSYKVMREVVDYHSPYLKGSIRDVSESSIVPGSSELSGASSSSANDRNKARRGIPLSGR